MDGIRYQVRSVSDADLAALQLPVAAAPTLPEEGVPPTEAEPPAVVGRAGSPAREEVPRSSPESSPRSWDGPIDEAFVNVGREDGVRASDVQQALSTAGVSEDDTAYVRVRQRHTFIGVRQGLLERVVSGLSGQTIAERAVEAQPARPRQARR